MEIIEYTAEMQKQIAHCYNSLTANVPHCYPVNGDELGKVLMCSAYETEDNTRDFVSSTIQRASVIRADASDNFG